MLDPLISQPNPNSRRLCEATRLTHCCSVSPHRLVIRPLVRQAHTLASGCRPTMLAKGQSFARTAGPPPGSQGYTRLKAHRKLSLSCIVSYRLFALPYVAVFLVFRPSLIPVYRSYTAEDCFGNPETRIYLLCLHLPIIASQSHLRTSA